MKNGIRRETMRRTVRLLWLAVLLGLVVLAAASAKQQPQQQPQYTREEAEAYNALYRAYQTGKFDEAVKVGEEFLSKFPNSILASRARPLLVVSYVQINNLDKAFEVGAQAVGADPNNFTVLYVLTLAASDASKARNTKYEADGLKYATQVLEMISSGQVPAGVSPATWESQKNSVLGQMHQAAGLFLYNKGDYEAALEHLKKAGELDAKDPVTFYLTGESLKLGKYAKLREDYDKLTADEKVAEAGKGLLKQVDEVVDQMVEYYARTVAIAESDAKFQALGQEARKVLEGFYRYRHNNTTEGMEDLIKKYKPGT